MKKIELDFKNKRLKSTIILLIISMIIVVISGGLDFFLIYCLDDYLHIYNSSDGYKFSSYFTAFLIFILSIIYKLFFHFFVEEKNKK